MAELNCECPLCGQQVDGTECSCEREGELGVWVFVSTASISHEVVDPRGFFNVLVVREPNPGEENIHYVRSGFRAFFLPADQLPYSLNPYKEIYASRGVWVPSAVVGLQGKAVSDLTEVSIEQVW